MKALGVLLLSCVVLTSAQANPDSLFVVIHGDTVHLWNTNVEVNCACRFAFDVTNVQHVITVVERDTSGFLAYCFCFFDLSVSLTGLEAGDYTVDVYRHFTLPYDTVIYVGSTAFRIGPGGAMMSSVGYQSECFHPTRAYEDPRPLVYALEQNYPNPFNPATTFRFSVAAPQLTILKVYDVLGREVATLVNEVKQPGTYAAQWEASEVASGVYMYRLQAGSYVATKKLIIVR